MKTKKVGILERGESGDFSKTLETLTVGEV